MAALSVPLRRSSRAKKAPPVLEDFPSYPDGPPSTELEDLISKLDQQAFPSAAFARVDDIVVQALFATKKNPRFYRALHPTRAFLQDGLPCSHDEATQICNIFGAAAKGSTNYPTVASKVTPLLIDKYPHLFSGKSDSKILKHLLQRYHILRYAPESNVRVHKVQFRGSPTVSGGLIATSRISASTVLLVLCSSMSSNLVHDQPSVSSINSKACHNFEEGPRLVLGPFRFANHDCVPNCQIMPIPNSVAYSLCTLCDIEAGEDITVNYSLDGSYFGDAPCGCTSCNPDAPPVAKKRPLDPSRFVRDPLKKKTRRGGKRAKRQRPNPPKEAPAEANIDVEPDPAPIAPL